MNKPLAPRGFDCHLDMVPVCWGEKSNKIHGTSAAIWQKMV
jgi:hypothetical protein